MDIFQKGDFLIVEIKTDKTAHEVFEVFQNKSHVFFLDSSQSFSSDGRYSFIGFDPCSVYEAIDIESLDVLRQKYEEYTYCSKIEETPLPAGLVGFISYDYGVKQEKIAGKKREEFIVPDVCFGLYDSIITFDHKLNKVFVTVLNVSKEESIQSESYRKLSSIFYQINEGSRKDFSQKKNTFDLNLISNFDKEQYYQAVIKILDYIKRGDVYQVNLSQCFTTEWGENSPSSFSVYKVLRDLSPSCFSAYYSGVHFQVLSSSPERFLHCDGKAVQTRPMKGTRPRGATEAEDAQLENELWGSEKDKAELLMITDLLRNDISRVCEYGSVKVVEDRVMEKYSTVFQTTSLIVGELKKEKNIFDLLEACSPGGSITGCPKIRSMEIIEEIEPTRRSIYTGSLGYISFTGVMDFNILIRTILVVPGKLMFQVGGGIVSDSDPEKEYQETLVKAKAMKQALEKVVSRGCHYE